MNKFNLYLIILLFGSVFQIQGQISGDIDKYVNPLVRNQDFSGVILISKNDSIIHLKGYGYANLEWKVENNKNSVFHIASLTKQFTASAILIAEQEGLLSVEDPINKYIPSYPHGAEIQIQHLLSQRSGIPDYNEMERYAEMSMKESSLSEVIDWFKNKPLEFTPGEKYSYSNSNFILAAKILEVASGKDYSEFLQKYIFNPLSMNQTGNFRYTEIVSFRADGHNPAPQGLKKAPYYNKSFKLGSGSLYSSALDLYKWDRALYDTSILSEKSKAKLFHDYGHNYGLGWGVYTRDNNEKFVSHDGKAPGYFSYMKRYINTNSITIIILSNVNSGIMNSMKADITDIVFENDFPVYESYEIKTLPDNLKQYTGRYTFPPKFHFTIVEKEGGLYFKWMDTPFLQYLTPIDNDKFLMRSRYDYLKFQRNEKEEIELVRYIQKSDTTICPIIN